MVNLKKRSMTLAGHSTSIALEPEFWAVLDQMAVSRGVTSTALIAELDLNRGARPLASACRLAALQYAQAR